MRYSIVDILNPKTSFMVNKLLVAKMDLVQQFHSSIYTNTISKNEVIDSPWHCIYTHIISFKPS